MKFTKMHGIGNDFVVVNALNATLDEAAIPEISRKVNDRKFGISQRLTFLRISISFFP